MKYMIAPTLPPANMKNMFWNVWANTLRSTAMNKMRTLPFGMYRNCITASMTPDANRVRAVWTIRKATRNDLAFRPINWDSLNSSNSFCSCKSKKSMIGIAGSELRASNTYDCARDRDLSVLLFFVKAGRRWCANYGESSSP